MKTRILCGIVACGAFAATAEEFNGRPIEGTAKSNSSEPAAPGNTFNGRPVEEPTPPSEPVYRPKPVASSYEAGVPKAALSLGLFGRGITYSLNFDLQLHESIALGLGFSYWNSFDTLFIRFEKMLVVPIYANFYLIGKRNRLFLTAGYTYFDATISGGLFSDIFEEEGWSSSAPRRVSGSFGDVGVGYELRLAPRGFLFRVQGHLLFNSYGILPIVGLNFGYAF